MDRSVKRPATSYQEKRRAAALEKQKSARRQTTDRARKLALGAAANAEQQEPQQQQDVQQPAAQQQDVELADSAAGTPSSAAPASPEIDMGGSAGAGRRRRSSSGSATSLRSPGGSGAALRQYYSQQLMQPEWLVDVPPDLGSEWYALPRPEGQRCLVIAARGQTVARLRNGALFERFGSPLPAGGRGQPAGEDNFCILDCIFHAPDQTYYVLDLMCWKGYSLYHCSAEFRLFWVQSKLAESGATSAFATSLLGVSSSSGGSGSSMGNGSGVGQPAAAPAAVRRFQPLPAYRCTPEGLATAHSGPVSFQRDGLLLLHKEGQYLSGQTPLALLWKDAASSRYFIDTDLAGAPLAQQQIVLEFRMDSTVATHDDAPVVLGRMPESFVRQLGDKLRPGKLLKFVIGPGGITFQDGQPTGADLHFAGPANQRRGRADSISKIIFQFLARTQPITLQQLAAAAAAAGGGGIGDKMGSCDSSALVAGSMSVVSADGGGSMAVDRPSDGIEVDS
ncbi:hypothetical protein ABPG75_002877 [Micractinium tetrahymenae]